MGLRYCVRARVCVCVCEWLCDCIWVRVEEGMAERACFVVAQTLVNELYAVSSLSYSEL